MKSRRPNTAFSGHEVKRFIAPSILAIVLFMVLIAVDGALAETAPNLWMTLYGLGGIICALLYTTVVTRSGFTRENLGWSFSLISGVTLGLLPYVLPGHLMDLVQILVVLGVMAVTIGSGRKHAIVTLITAFIIGLPGSFRQFTGLTSMLGYLAPFIISVIATETYTRIKSTTQQ